MKKVYNRFALFAGQVDSRYLKLIVMVVTLVMFVIGGGAPDDGGGAGCSACPD